MFVKLFLEDDADESLAEQERRRAATRVRRTRVRQAARVTVRDRDRRASRPG
jgi:hypothetical protein